MLSQKRYMFSGGIFPAFTIIELLVVVSIIGLLVTILAPSLNQVRTYTRSVRTAAIIKNVSTGLESFHSEQSIGGDYPPSLWNANGNNPYDANGQKTNTDTTLCPPGVI